MRAWRERWARLDPVAVDRGLAAVMAALSAIAVFASTQREGSIALNLALALLVASSLLWRRRAPLVACCVAAAGCISLTAFLTPSFYFAPTTITLILVAFFSGLNLSGRRSWSALVLVAGTIATICVLYTPEDILFPTIVFGMAPWFVGRGMRSQTALNRELADKEALLSQLREEERRNAVVAERSRMARELHDVLAHNLSVMIIQASGARRLLATDSAAAVDAAGLIERTGREALVELRHVLGPVHHGEGEALDGSPGLVQLEPLLQRSRGAGLPVELAVEGDPVELGPGADMAAYRLIQEALTNTLKHAGPAPTRVRLRWLPDGLRIEVADEGATATAGPAQPLAGSGHGLIGMRERIGLYGGTVEAGPVAGGGFAVRAKLPTTNGRTTR
ncbi:MAG: histidine kinase [Solirubrobacterales bacterium]